MEGFIGKLFKMVKVHKFLKGIMNKLIWPIDPEMPVYINDKHLDKLDNDQKKLNKFHVPKKFLEKASKLTNSEAPPAVESQQTSSISQNKNKIAIPYVYHNLIPISSKFKEG